VREEATRETFLRSLRSEEGVFMRAGDMELFHKRELFIYGPPKDVMILGGGRNMYQQDIQILREKLVEALSRYGRGWSSSLRT
jgi:hypothetical protein